MTGKTVSHGIEYSHLMVSAISGFALMGLLFILLPENANVVPSLCIGWGVFWGLPLFLGQSLEKGQVDLIHVTLAFTSVQLIMLGVFAPWFGWTNDVVSGWFGRYFFITYVLGPLVALFIVALLKRRRG